MADQEPKEEKKEPKAKAEEAPKEAAPSGPKRKKVSRMKFSEVEGELKTVKEKMGGFYSSFARHLLARRKELEISSK